MPLHVLKRTYGYDDLLIIPRFSVVESRSEVDLTTTLGEINLSAPVISANMDTVTEQEMANAMYRAGGLGIVHRYMRLEARLAQLAYMRNLPWRAMSVGVTADELSIGKQLINHDANILCIDIAHGHSTGMNRALGELRTHAARNNKQVHFIAGNVTTPQAVQDLEAWGADTVKVGIANGAACTTKFMTGVGYGQLSAIADCADAAKKVSIIADGGIKNSGDAVKALAAGADAVMVGRLLAGTDEVPVVARGGLYRGMASSEAQSAFYGLAPNQKHAEGKSMQVAAQGPVQEVLKPFLGGIRSGLSYVGVHTLPALRTAVEFVEAAHGVSSHQK